MRRALVVSLLLAAAACGGGKQGPPLPLRRVEDIPLPGSTGRFDYMSFDPGRHLLAVAHLSDDTVLAFDTAAQRVLWQAGGISSAHGVRVAPEIGRVFASATGTNEVVAIDEATGAVLARAPTGRFPDGLAYDARTQTVFVSNKDAGTETVVDARTMHAVGDVPVGADVGNVQYDDVGQTMVVAVGSTNELVTIAPADRRVIRRIRLPGCRGAHGVVLDPPTSRAFVACEDNARTLSVDLGRSVVTASRPTGNTPDVLAFDPGSQRLYVAAESGVVSVYTTSGGRLAVVGSARVTDGAHTVAVDPARHLVYLALPDVRGRPVISVMAPIR